MALNEIQGITKVIKIHPLSPIKSVEEFYDNPSVGVEIFHSGPKW